MPDIERFVLYRAKNNRKCFLKILRFNLQTAITKISPLQKHLYVTWKRMVK